MTRALILECWRSGQIDPAEMVRLCAADPELERIRVEQLTNQYLYHYEHQPRPNR